MMEAIREMAQQIILAYADDADAAGKPHVAHSERMMAEYAVAGLIDEGKTIQNLVRNICA